MITTTFLMAITAIRRNAMRSFLTTLGVIIGVASVIAMVTLGRGATASVTSRVSARPAFITPCTTSLTEPSPPTAAMWRRPSRSALFAISSPWPSR